MNTFFEGQLAPGHYTSAGRPVMGEGAQFPMGAPAVVPQAARDHWADKVTAMLTGWKAVLGGDCTVPCAVLACAVAEHETRCGDAWPGEHNWGAVQKRPLTLAEQQVLADAKVQPKPQNVAVARKALADAAATGQLQAETNGALHVDSSPGRGWYWVYFWAFDNDAHGAAFFAGVLAGKNRPKCRAVLESGGGAEALAREMYATHYYEGFHVPTETIQLPDGTTRTGAEQNVLDYAGSVAACAKEIESVLGDWAPDAGDLATYAATANLQAVDELIDVTGDADQ